MATIEVPNQYATRVLGFTLNIEWAYEDYSPMGQQTPSRLESITFATEQQCRAAQEALDTWADQQGLSGQLSCWRNPNPELVPPGELVTGASSVIALAENLVAEVRGEGHDV